MRCRGLQPISRPPADKTLARRQPFQAQLGQLPETKIPMPEGNTPEPPTAPAPAPAVHHAGPIEFEDVVAAMRRLGHRVFDRGNFNLNVVGIRRTATRVNAFNDVLISFYPLNGQWMYTKFQITTLPGITFLRDHLGHAAGTAILVPDQYRGKYCVRLHDDAYEAFCQKQDPGVFVQVFRDSRLNGVPEMDPDTITNARGINIHRANPSNCTVSVDEFSAGCQVFRCAAQFDSFMAQVRQSQRIFGNSFTYTLLAESEL